MITTEEYISKIDRQDEASKKLVVEYNKALVEKYPFLLPRNRFSDEVIDDYDWLYTEMDSMPDGWRKAFGDQMLEEIKNELVKFNFLDKYRILQIKEKYGTLRWYDAGTPAPILSKDFREYVLPFGEPIPEYDHDAEFCISKNSDMDGVDISGLSIEKRFELLHKSKVEYRLYRIVKACNVPKIISKYEKMSEFVCIDCGKMDEPLYMSKGWINYVCKDCAERRLEKMKKYLVEDDCELDCLFYSPEQLKQMEEKRRLEEEIEE